MVPQVFELSALPRAASRLACAAIGLIGASVLLGWTIGSTRLISIIPGMFPMPPETALLSVIAAAGLWCCCGSPSRFKGRIMVGFGGFILLAGMTRLCISLLGAEPGIDTPLVRGMLGGSASSAPTGTHIHMVTSLSFALVGATLLLINLHNDWSRNLAFLLMLAGSLLATLTVGHFAFPDALAIGPQNRAFPRSVVTLAVLVLLPIAGVLLLFIPSEKSPAASPDDGRIEPTPQSLMNPVAIGFGLAVFMLASGGIFSYQAITQFVADTRWNYRRYQALAAADVLYSAVKNAEASERGYIITGDAEFGRKQLSAMKLILPALDDLRALSTDDPAQQRQVGLLEPLIQRKMKVLQNLFLLRRDQGFESARQGLSSGEGVRLTETIRQVLDNMTAEDQVVLSKRLTQTETNARRGVALIIFGSTFASVIVTAAGWKVIRDMKRRAEVDDALRASESMFRGLLQAAPDAMVIVDGRGQIELVNARAVQLFGYKSNELIGQQIELLVPDCHKGSHVGMRDAYFATPTVREMGAGKELFGRRKDGSEFPLEISLSPLRTSAGLRVSSAIRDVSRRKEADEDLARLNTAISQSNSRLEAANKELEAFSYSVSHDLRAPLRSIDGFSQAILEDYSEKLDDEGKDHLHRVRAASQRMGQLIDDLLNLSRVTRAELVRESVDLSKVAREIADELRKTAPERDADFVIADGLIADTDPRLVRILLTNLLGNAWKFTSKRPHARIEFGCSGENGSKTYFARDNGAGFDSAYAGKLFGAFQRLHSTTEFPGTGIGLATVARIVRRQGGRVWAEGKADQGATFHFTL